ncbi:ABC transporter ATP-binding protein [Paenibacillus alba]|uniref:ABC transporter ATP-binding protein n=1 Tax=Paenibacillus alba TaxID=1197127 RepID=A0ABU6FZW0_9BACL|nr:ABC transporter ATP-binding protein [Paenibacillus alba]MEC0226168.1 ABC transporter ATP-binding protein [Paenibacillus alba]NQX68631.1 ABC transporter ATP-binding protein [Paenibacillus alba]
MDTTRKVLQVSGLNVKVTTDQGQLQLLHDIHFDLNEGQILGLVGESGCGKSMTCHSLLQLMDHHTIVEGSIQLGGRELNGLDPKEMRRIRGKEIGFIRQNPMNAFTPVYSIGNQFIETIRAHSKLSKKEAYELAAISLENVNLPKPYEILKMYPFQLSGGMLQRVMIAMCMCLKPAVVIADEPTTALDMVNQLQVLSQLERLRSECGTTILLISHDLSVIAEMADEVMVMQHGKIVEQANVFELFDHPANAYTKKLLNARLQLPDLSNKQTVEYAVNF